MNTAKPILIHNSYYIRIYTIIGVCYCLSKGAGFSIVYSGTPSRESNFMDNFDKVGLQVSFRTVFHILTTKQIAMTENGKANIIRAIQFLDIVIKSIDSLRKTSGQDNENIYFFVPNLVEIINITKTNPKISEEKVIESKNHYLKVKEKLELLQKDPRNFFSSPADDMINTISKIIDIYSEDPYIVERDFTFSEIS